MSVVVRYQDLRVWEDNEDVRSCFRCKKRFGVITWKHHCRACGRIMCKKCTRFYTKLPVSELCPDCPEYISNKLPQRCCLECSERVRAHVEADKETAQRRQGKTVVGVKIIDSIEYIPSYHSKVYVVQIPQDRTVHANQMLRVVLGGRLNHVNVPYGVGPGHLLYVRANDVFVRYPQDSGPQVVAVDTSTLVDQVVLRLQETMRCLPAPHFSLTRALLWSLSDTQSLPLGSAAGRGVGSAPVSCTRTLSGPPASTCNSSF